MVISRIDKDGSLSVEWEEFRNFMQLAPSGDLEDIISYWRQNLVSKNACRVRLQRSKMQLKSTMCSTLKLITDKKVSGL